jgi:hypothetical protein
VFFADPADYLPEAGQQFGMRQLFDIPHAGSAESRRSGEAL